VPPQESPATCAGPSAKPFDQRREAICVVGQAELRRHIRGAPRPGLVPADDRELVGQGGELRAPYAVVVTGTVHEQQRRALADALVGDLKPARPDDLHGRNVDERARE